MVHGHEADAKDSRCPHSLGIFTWECWEVESISEYEYLVLIMLMWQLYLAIMLTLSSLIFQTIPRNLRQQAEMLIPCLVVLSTMVNISYGSPVLGNKTAELGPTISKRNPCDGINAMPALYHEYREADCPAPNHFLPDARCEGYNDIQKNPDCVAFCQVRRWYHSSWLPPKMIHYNSI